MQNFSAIKNYLVFCIVLLAGCSKEADRPPLRGPIPEVADQTIVLYMTGTDLGYAFRQNLRGTMQALDEDILGQSRFLVFQEPAKGEGELIELFYSPREKGCEIEVLKKWSMEGFSSMDSRTVTEILSLAAEKAPANHYGLIIGGHATAWVPQDGQAATMGMMAYDDIWAPAPGALPTRYIGDPGRREDIPDLAAAIAASGATFDYLIFDTCFMSSIEALYDLRGLVEQIVASPVEIMAEGFPYADIVPSLLTENGASHDLEAACETFYSYYQNRAKTPSGCITLIQTNELEALASAVKEIEAVAGTYDPATLQTYEGASQARFYDLRGYVTAICTDDALLSQFEEQMERAFPVRLHTDEFYSAYNNRMNPIDAAKYSGVSTSAPCATLADAWKKTTWYAATH